MEKFEGTSILEEIAIERSIITPKRNRWYSGTAWMT